MKVVIIGGIHHNTLGVIRSIGSEGISSEDIALFIVDEHGGKKDFVSKSKYLKKSTIRYLKTYDEILEALYRIADKNEKKAIVCCAEGASEVVMSNADNLKEFFFCSSIGVKPDFFFNKNDQSLLAKESGFAIPRGEIIDTKKGKVDWDIFPCIIKPIKSIKGAGKNDIKIAKNREELSTLLEEVVSETVQIQEYIEKKMEFQLIGCSLEKGEKIIIPGFTQIIRQPDNTNTGYLRYSPISQLDIDINRINLFFQKIKYDGLFSIEFIRGENNVDYYLETNLRNDGNAYCVKSAGINLPYIWCYYQVNKTLPKNVALTFEKPVFFMPEFADIKMGIKSVGVLKWIMQMVGAKSHAIFNLKDMKPFFARAKYSLVTHLH